MYYILRILLMRSNRKATKLTQHPFENETPSEDFPEGISSKTKDSKPASTPYSRDSEYRVPKNST